MIGRGVVETAMFVVSEARTNLFEKLMRAIEISPLVNGFVRERESPGDSGVVLEQPGNRRMPHQSAIRVDALNQKVCILANDVVVAVECQAGVGECCQHPSVPARQNFFIARRPHALRSHAIELALSAGDEIGLRFHIADDVENVDALPIAAVRHIEQFAKDAAFVLA